MEQALKSNNAKFTFFYLLSLVALISLTLSVGTVLFQVINKLVVDTINQFSGVFNAESIKFAIASIIIAGPIYYFTTWQINKNLKSGDLPKDAAARRWLSYLLLFIASVVMLGWLIGVIFNFLDGELTLKFILKALVSILLSGTIFGYYLYDVRREQPVGVTDKVVNGFFYATLAVVLASLITAFFFVETPGQTRDRKHDQAITASFDMIDSSLNSFYSEKKDLPGSLQVLVDEKRFLSEDSIKNRSTGKPFEYKRISDKSYELCADFLTSNKDEKNALNFDRTRWPHDAGRQCLTQQIFQADSVPVKPLPTSR